jgi:Carboxypeptidase regulatory-like domain
MRNLKKVMLPILLFAVGGVVKANTEKPEAVLHGYVTDAITKKPVSGVLVSATALGVNISKEVTTDADGYFSFVQLPAQQVNLQFDKKGYQGFKRANITVKEKTPVKLTITFLPESPSDDSDEIEYPLLRMFQLQ